MELDLQVSPEEIMSREGELACESWTSFASSCSTSRWAMARGHRLNISIVLAAVHGLSGLFRAVSAVEPSLCRPPHPPVPDPNNPPRFCGRKAKWSWSWSV